MGLCRCFFVEPSFLLGSFVINFYLTLWKKEKKKSVYCPRFGTPKQLSYTHLNLLTRTSTKYLCMLAIVSFECWFVCHMFNEKPYSYNTSFSNKKPYFQNFSDLIVVLMPFYLTNSEISYGSLFFLPSLTSSFPFK